MGRVASALIALTVLVAGCGAQPQTSSIAVGSGSDPESMLVANLYAAALRSYGTPAHVEQVPDPLTKLDAGDVRVVAGFTGRLLHRFDPDSTARSAAQVYRDMVSALPEGIAAGDYTESAEDKPALVVTEATADGWGAHDVTAAVRHCDTLNVVQVVDAPRPDAIGSCKPKVAELPGPAKTFAAVMAGRFNAAWTSTASPDIPSELLMLSDRTSLIRAENLVPLYRRNELTEPQVLALNEVAGVLDTAALADMRRRVAGGDPAGNVAGTFLAEHPLGD